MDLPALPWPALPWDGGCRCGRLRFRVTEAPLITSVCHCRGCQRMSGSAYSTTASFPTAAFELTTGEAVIGGAPSDMIRHHHCDSCKSWTYTTIVPDAGFVNVRGTLFDDATWFAPFIETQTAERLPWVSVPVAHSFDRFPAMETYLGLSTEFRAQIAFPAAPGG